MAKHMDIKWIKIATNIFSDEKILLIEQMPDADTIIVIWFKLLCMAGKENNCGVFVMGNKIAYTDEMLATIFHRPLNTIRLALSTFEAFGMIEILADPSGNDVYTIPNWEKHQNIDGMEKIREQTRLRVAKHRENQKKALECNVTVTQGNATDKDKDKDKDKDVHDSQNESHHAIYQDVISYLNQVAGTNYRASSKKTQSCIHARLEEGFVIEDFKTVIDKKSREWIGTEFEKFLRPETLFGTKFEGYLNSRINPKQTTVTNNHVYNRVSAVDSW